MVAKSEKALLRWEEKLARKERELQAYAKQLDDVKETYDAYHRDLMEKFDHVAKAEADIAKREATVAQKEVEYAQHYYQVQEMVQYKEALDEQVAVLRKELEKLNKQKLQAMKPAVMSGSGSKKLMPPGFKR